MSWHKISLTLEQIEKQGVLQQIEKQFEQIYLTAQGPSDMAMFSDNDYTDSHINIYFTPGCSPACDALISKYQGEGCPAPDVEQVSLVTGNDDAEDLLDSH